MQKNVADTRPPSRYPHQPSHHIAGAPPNPGGSGRPASTLTPLLTEPLVALLVAVLVALLFTVLVALPFVIHVTVIYSRPFTLLDARLIALLVAALVSQIVIANSTPHRPNKTSISLSSTYGPE